MNILTHNIVVAPSKVMPQKGLHFSEVLFILIFLYYFVNNKNSCYRISSSRELKFIIFYDFSANLVRTGICWCVVRDKDDFRITPTFIFN